MRIQILILGLKGLMLVQLYLSNEWINLPKNSIKYKSWHFELQELDLQRIIY